MELIRNQIKSIKKTRSFELQMLNTMRVCSLFFFYIHSIFFFICDNFNTHFPFYSIFPCISRASVHIYVSSLFSLDMVCCLFHPWKKCTLRLHKQRNTQQCAKLYGKSFIFFLHILTDINQTLVITYFCM